MFFKAGPHKGTCVEQAVLELRDPLPGSFKLFKMNNLKYPPRSSGVILIVNK